MKRHPKLIPLSRFHRSVLFLALVAKKNAPEIKGYPVKLEDKAEYAISFYKTLLSPHFALEEDKLFHVVRGKDINLDLLLEDFLLQRKHLNQLFRKLEDSKQLENDLHELGIVLEKHIRKEERVVFQTIQKILTEEDWKEIEI